MSKYPKSAGIVAIGFTFALCGGVAHAQQPQKISRIGYLSPQTPAREAARAETIRSALRELGYVEGQNILIEYRYANGYRDHQPELAAELVRLNVDVILVTGGEPYIRGAMKATRTIPIVMTGPGPDPVEAKLVKSLARPGGNLTGVTYLSTELGGKRLELLKEAIPKIVRVAVIYDHDAPGTAQEVKSDLPIAARALGLSIRSSEVIDSADLDKALASIDKQRPDGLYIPLTGALMRANARRITDFALTTRLPALYGIKEGMDAGGLMYYGADLEDIHHRVAYYVDKILKGAKAAALPIERPTKFELIINLKTAQQIGLTIPPNVLARANRVIR
jgi:putative ABC transport system substrate-binding protein